MRGLKNAFFVLFSWWPIESMCLDGSSYWSLILLSGKIPGFFTASLKTAVDLDTSASPTVIHRTVLQYFFLLKSVVPSVGWQFGFVSHWAVRAAAHWGLSESHSCLRCRCRLNTTFSRHWQTPDKMHNFYYYKTFELGGTFRQYWKHLSKVMIIHCTLHTSLVCLTKIYVRCDNLGWNDR